MWLVVFVFWQDRQPDHSVVLFFPVIVFSSRNWCVRILTWQTVIWDLFQPLVRRLYLFFWVVIFSGGSKNIAGQTTVPFFFWVLIFSSRNWCSYFDTSTNYGTYIRPEKITTRKKGTVKKDAHNAIRASTPGQVIDLPKPPDHIIIDINPIKRIKWPHYLNLSPNSNLIWIPIGLTSWCKKK